MLVDEVTIKVRGGDGGKGDVAFGEGKFSSRPSGGDGGNGGNVYLEASREVADLSRFRYEKSFRAPDGEQGKRNAGGSDGVDVILPVPRGTIVHNLTTGQEDEMVDVGMRLLVGKGGVRGRGNSQFATARTYEPDRYEEGRSGYEADLSLELQLVADIGLFGLPNVGKSSLLNVLTGAKSKVANYLFTTLEPHLGVLPSGLIMADIPGLIEGASEGKGLGAKFLRHIARTAVLAHCISAESDDVIRDYRIIRGEIEAYGRGLAEKKEYLVITKSDNVTAERLAVIKKEAKKLNKNFSIISVYDDAALKEFGDNVTKFARGEEASSAQLPQDRSVTTRGMAKRFFSRKILLAPGEPAKVSVKKPIRTAKPGGAVKRAVKAVKKAPAKSKAK